MTTNNRERFRGGYIKGEIFASHLLGRAPTPRARNHRSFHFGEDGCVLLRPALFPELHGCNETVNLRERVTKKRKRVSPD
jgi:hypothetical protein